MSRVERRIRELRDPNHRDTRFVEARPAHPSLAASRAVPEHEQRILDKLHAEMRLAHHQRGLTEGE
jgi:hypothetical protein